MRDKYKKREEERVRLENEELERNYTFKPMISKDNEHAKRQDMIANSMPRNASERLAAGNNYSERDILKKQQEDQETKRHKFNPEINLESKAMAYKRRIENGTDVNKPIFQQLIESKKVKEAKMRQKLVENEMAKHEEYKPEINEISCWIAKQRTDKSVFERLTDEVQSKGKQIEFEDENCTFQPNLVRDNSMVSHESKASRFDDFYQRQKKFIESKEDFYSKSSKDEKCTFKPKINVCSEFLVETN